MLLLLCRCSHTPFRFCEVKMLDLHVCQRSCRNVFWL